MKVLIATKRDRDYEFYIKAAHASGHDVYVDEDRGEFFIKIGQDRVYRAEGAEFKSIPSGLYTFEADGSAKLVHLI